MKIKKYSVSKKFLKASQKLSKKHKVLLNRKQKVFCLNPYDSSLKTHQLKGRLSGLWSFSINYSMKVLFRFITEDEVMFLDVGTHEVYK